MAIIYHLVIMFIFTYALKMSTKKKHANTSYTLYA